MIDRRWYTTSVKPSHKVEYIDAQGVAQVRNVRGDVTPVVKTARRMGATSITVDGKGI